MRRREFIAGLGAAGAWPLATRAASGNDGVLHLRRLADEVPYVTAFQRLGLLRILETQATTIAFLADSTNRTQEFQEQDVRDAARKLGRTIIIVSAASERDFDAAFATIDREGVGALAVAASSRFFAFRDRLIAFVACRQIPAIYPHRELGMTCGSRLADAMRQGGVYLPAMLPAKFEFVIKTGDGPAREIPYAAFDVAEEMIEKRIFPELILSRKRPTRNPSARSPV